MKKLCVPQLLDLSKNNNLLAYIDIVTNVYKFSPNSGYSGTNKKSPIFGSTFYLENNKNIVENIFGLPFFRMKKGDKYTIIFNNKTGYSFDLHWHGLNTYADIDGASSEVVFGLNTKIGETLKIEFPSITNNSSMLWVHAHPMFDASKYVYSGVVGMVEIIDNETDIVNKLFDYSDNYLMLIYQDIEINSDGTLNDSNVYTDAWRSCFGTINGQICLNWYSDNNEYVNLLYHNSNKNIIKISILNSSGSFRNIYLGVCDKNNNIKFFYNISNDNGLRNPQKINILTINPANRSTVLFDLLDFEDNEAYLFFYNFDLSEVLDIEVDDNNNLIGNIPDIIKSSDPTPSPTPIPESESDNNGSPLEYPYVPAIPYINSLIPGGKQILPKTYNIKKYLNIKYQKSNVISKIDIKDIINNIRKIVFGENYNNFLIQNLVKFNSFEYYYANVFKKNYISLLNPKYYYNLPSIEYVPLRSFALFPDGTYNYIGPNNKVIPYYNDYYNNNIFINKNIDSKLYSYNYVSNGSTELAFEASRIYVDMWNNYQLNDDESRKKYYGNYVKNKFFSYKPSVLPNCLFKIFPTNEDSKKYVNYNMISNDILNIDIYKSNADINIDEPLYSTNIIFDKINTPVNIEEWTNIVNNKFKETIVMIPGFDPDGDCGCKDCNCMMSMNKNKNKTHDESKANIGCCSSKSVLKCNCGEGCNCGSNCECGMGMLSDILEYDWTYYPYAIYPYYLQNNMEKKILNNVMIRVTNKTEYKIKISGKWTLLNFFGKPLSVMEDDMEDDMDMKNMPMPPEPMPPEPMPTNLDMYINTMFVYYPDPLNPFDANNPDNTGTLLRNINENVYFIVDSLDKLNEDRENNGVYKGFVDGFMNDAFFNFSVKLNSSEKWTYYNMDAQDTHPFHFHLTSGYVDYMDSDKSIILNPVNYYDQYAYSKDTYGVPSQQKLSFYLKFINYTSKQSGINNGEFPNIGFMYHCHYMVHHDMNMMGQYYVFE